MQQSIIAYTLFKAWSFSTLVLDSNLKKRYSPAVQRRVTIMTEEHKQRLTKLRKTDKLNGITDEDSDEYVSDEEGSVVWQICTAV